MKSILQATNKQILTTPEEHVLALHGGGEGVAVLAFKSQGKWREIRVGPKSMVEKARAFAGRTNVYISQNRFKGRRQKRLLLFLNALYCDLDYYKLDEFARRSPEHMLQLVYDTCELERMPPPSYVISTGRGLSLTWLHEPVPKAALPRWEACQKRILEAFKPLGADPQAKDCTRVLRLVGTKHGGSGEIVRCLTPVGHRWNFDRLADELLPVERAVLHDLQAQRALRSAASAANKGAAKPLAPPRGFTAQTLWQARLADLSKLLEMRYGARPIPPGERNAWLFVAAVGLSWLSHHEVARQEIIRLAQRVTGGAWMAAETETRMWSVLRRAELSASGQEQRYRMTTQEIIERLNISEQEQADLQVLISSQRAKERARERNKKSKAAARRKAGMMPRSEYLAQAAKKRQTALELRSQGLKLKEIAAEMGVSLGAVWGYLKTD